MLLHGTTMTPHEKTQCMYILLFMTKRRTECHAVMNSYVYTADSILHSCCLPLGQHLRAIACANFRNVGCPNIGCPLGIFTFERGQKPVNERGREHCNVDRGG